MVVSGFQKLIQVQLLDHQIVLEKTVMLKAVDLDQHAVALGDPVDPLALVDGAVPLEHPSTPVPLVVDEVTPILDPRGPANLSLPLDLALLDRARVDGLERLASLAEQRDRATPDFALFGDGDLPVARTVLAPLDEVAGENAPIVPDQLPVALRLTVAEIPNVRPAVLVGLHSRPVLESVLEEALVDIAQVRFKDAVAPGFIV